MRLVHRTDSKMCLYIKPGAQQHYGLIPLLGSGIRIIKDAVNKEFCLYTLYTFVLYGFFT